MKALLPQTKYIYKYGYEGYFLFRSIFQYGHYSAAVAVCAFVLSTCIVG